MKTFILTFAFVLAFSAYGFCHSPSDIEATIDGTHVELTVLHSVGDPTDHYVKRIEVKLNDTAVADRDFDRQTDAEHQETGFDIPVLKKGDVLEVTAYCSRYGELTKKITVE